MKVEMNDLLTVKGQQYITLDVIKKDEDTFAFVNKVINYEPTEEYYIFQILGDGNVVILNNKNKMNELLPLFSKNLEKMVDFALKMQRGE